MSTSDRFTAAPSHDPRRSAPAPQTQQKITEAYEFIGHELGALVVPVGVAWQRVLEMNVLHDKGQSHPMLAGSYLAGCVFFAALFRESPVGIEVDVKGRSAKDAALLQRAAAEVRE